MSSSSRPAYLREILLAVGVLFCVGYAWLSTTALAPNERARVYLSVALVDRGEVKIDREVERFGRNWDLSKKDGHWYCNKPPGASFLGAVVYQVARWVGGEGDWSMPGLFHLMRFGLMLPIALLGFLAIRRWMRLYELSEATIDLASVGWMMGSAAFHYSGAFFSHHIVAVFLVVAIWLLERTRMSLNGTEPGRDEPESVGLKHAAWGALAGLSLGIVGLTEYQAGISALFVALWLLAHRELRQLRVLIPFAVAAAACLGLLFWYDTVAFGGPLEFSYEYHISENEGEPISYPRLKYFAGLLFDLEWGLFLNAPWFVLMFPGFYYLGRRWERWDLFALFAAIFGFRLVLMSGYDWWMGGWAFGPRHLVASMGFLTVLSAIALEQMRSSFAGHALARGLILTGLLYNQVQVAFLGELPKGPDNPIMDVVVPFYNAGIPSPNLVAGLWGVRGVESLIPLAVVVAAFAVFVLVRGLSRIQGGARRAAVLAIALAPAAAFFLHVYARGPSRSERKIEQFQRLMERRLEEDVDWFRADNREPADSDAESAD